ncbi:metallophosphoesterase [Desulfosarcina sp.]|nr:metallophosphoesterase [Desulfosarcina sp.]
MKFRFLLFALLFLPLIFVGQTTSIYDIQYTTNSGNGTYPSPLVGQYVTVGGIVTAYGYNDDNYFISSSAGGAWSGIFIYDNNYYPYVGDSIILQGLVYEYNGLTEIKSISSFNVVSAGNPLPSPAQVSTNDVYTQEAYESVFVEINNAQVTQSYDEWNEWRVDDGSGPCLISDGMFNLKETGFPLLIDYPFEKIAGIISYSYGGFRLHPREISDLQSAPGANVLSVNDQMVYSSDIFEVPVKLSIINQSSVCTSYHIQLEFDPMVVEYAGFNTNGTLSEGGDIVDLSFNGNVILNFTGDFSFSDIQTLINLNFSAFSAGSSDLTFLSASINSNEFEYLQNGIVTINFNGLAIGDTLTVIQRPIQNIPEIVFPGEEFEITCLAPENTADWQAELVYNDFIVPLVISEAFYDQNLQRWFLNASLSQINLYELYDLKVAASGDLLDITKNAVQVIPLEKEDFYFVHITDAHLPTHYFYEDPESVYDTSEMNDLREVIKDINLMRPEFVLLTGDLVNEGELEDFENRRNHTKAQRILSEFEVPVYLVPGNHDLGGWDETPPPQGTSRNEWWRFFGWQWLKPNSGELYYTQDYSFDYGPIHFVGLESYINYDGYLFNIYGDESFIPTQLEWLENDLLNANESHSKVLFYHKDYANQLNLSSLGVDMALWGHIHNNSGSIYTQPYDLATESVCDYNSAYRVINVNNGVLTPNYTSYAGFQGGNLDVDYYPSNNDEADSVTAVINNQQYVDFGNGIIKFVMPKGNFNYIVENGELQQVDSSGVNAICYVGVNIPSNSNVTVSIRIESASSINNPAGYSSLQLYQNYPNPFTVKTSIRFQILSSQKVKLEIYDLSGKLIKTLKDEKLDAGFHSVIWDGKNDKGIEQKGNVYFCRLNTEAGVSEIIRIIKL